MNHPCDTMFTPNLAIFIVLIYTWCFLLWFWDSSFFVGHLYKLLRKTIYSTLFLNGLLIHQPLVYTVTKLSCQNIYCEVYFPDWWFHSASLALHHIISTVCLSILHTGAEQEDPQVITGDAGSETGSCAVDFMWLCIWVPSPASQFSCWRLHSFCFPVCMNLMPARGYRPVWVLYWTWQTYP